MTPEGDIPVYREADPPPCRTTACVRERAEMRPPCVTPACERERAACGDGPLEAEKHMWFSRSEDPDFHDSDDIELKEDDGYFGWDEIRICAACAFENAPSRRARLRTRLAPRAAEAMSGRHLTLAMAPTLALAL